MNEPAKSARRVPQPEKPRRPQPEYLPGGMFVPGPLCYVVVSALRSLQVSSPRIKDDARLVLAAAEDADVRHHQALNLAAAAAKSCAAETAAVLSPAQLLPASEWISTAQAAGLLGVTPQWIRRLVALEKIRGRRVARSVLEVDRGSAVAYDERRRHGHGGGTPPEGEGPGGRPRGGAIAA